MMSASAARGLGERAISPRELAASAGISTDTLRHYERCGVLPKPARTRAGYRRYPADAVRRVALIRRALTIGFSLKELARVFQERDQGGAPCRKVRAIVFDRLRRIDAELEALTALKHDLTGMLRQWDAVLDATPVGKPVKLLESLVTPGWKPGRGSCTEK